MFTRCYADNFGCFSSFELPLEPLTILMGPNGSGKSTLLNLLGRLRDFILGRGTSLEFFPSETLTRWDQREEQTFEMTYVAEQRANFMLLAEQVDPAEGLVERRSLEARPVRSAGRIRPCYNKPSGPSWTELPASTCQ